jgi:hypothetical protein
MPLVIVLVNWLAFDQPYELKVLSGIGLVLIGVIMLQKSARGVTVLVPYSTRHTLKDNMRTLRTPLMYQLDIMGQQKGNEIANVYGDGAHLVYLQQELQKASELSDWGPEAGAR